jgi:isopropylmalate/homocitrate/citramalate synthase
MNGKLMQKWFLRWFKPELFIDEVTSRDDRKILFCDSTLREGLEEGSACWSSIPDELGILEMASRIDEAGIFAIELPNPANKTLTHYDRIKSAINNAEIIIKIKVNLDNIGETKKEIDLAVNEGRADRISNDDAGISEWSIESSSRRQHQDLESLKRFLSEIISYTKETYGVKFHASTSDFARAPLERITEFAKLFSRSGADMYTLKDTFGTANPYVMRKIVRHLKEQVPDMAIGVHCHDDMGLGTANSIAGIEAGASWVEACFNGIGDRAGHTTLEQVACILDLSYGLETGVDLTKMRNVSKLVQKMTGLYFPTKAFVGDAIFNEDRKRHLMHVISLKLWLMQEKQDNMMELFKRVEKLIGSEKTYVTEADLERVIAEFR